MFVLCVTGRLYPFPWYPGRLTWLFPPELFGRLTWLFPPDVYGRLYETWLDACGVGGGEVVADVLGGGTDTVDDFGGDTVVADVLCGNAVVGGDAVEPGNVGAGRRRRLLKRFLLVRCVGCPLPFPPFVCCLLKVGIGRLKLPLFVGRVGTFTGCLVVGALAPVGGIAVGGIDGAAGMFSEGFL